MVIRTDVTIGELYSIELPDEEERVFAEFAKELRDGRLMFKREGTDLELYFHSDEFEQMRSDGRADRVRLDQAQRIISDAEIDPRTILDPDDPNITLKERRARLLQQQKLERARTLRFYVIRYDSEPHVGRGRLGVEKFIKKHLPAAREEGFTWKPSPSSLLRAADDYGSPDARFLAHFLKQSDRLDRGKRWPSDVMDAANRAIEAYWDDQAFSVGDALAQFSAEATDIDNEHFIPTEAADAPVIVERGDDRDENGRLKRKKKTWKSSYPIPCLETVRLWIHQNADWWHWAQRYGEANANRRFKGRGKAIEATRPLEYVMFDHTLTDVWAVVQDDNGEPLFVARAWLTLAVDVYSRMILGAHLGFDTPSIHTVTRCLRQVVSRKDFLIERYGYLKGATDGWGRPFTIIVDNGKEFVSPSFQASCEAVGIDVEWAPVRMPTYKAYVERAFGTLNTILWHKLPGGLPLSPQLRQDLGLEPEAEAAYPLRVLEAAMWDAIINLYHLKVHTGTGMDVAPALKWRRGLENHKRATVDSVRSLEKIVGKGKMCQLSAEGIFVGGHRFHDQQLTSMLMNRLARFGKAREQRKGVTSSRTVRVRVTWDPGNVSQVHVWDPTTRNSVTLPNVRPEFASGLSWYAADRIKEYATANNMAFHSDAEMAKARVAHRKFLLDIMPGLKNADRRARARMLEHRTELMPGDRVETVAVEPGQHDVQYDTASRRASEDIPVKKGRPFGGKAGAKKAAATREKNREAKDAIEQSDSLPRQTPPVPPTTSTDSFLVDKDAIAARVKARLAAKNNGNQK